MHHGSDQVFFGATVTYANAQRRGAHASRIKGIDEADNLHGEVSWVSPIARALLKAREGDEVQLMTPGGLRDASRCSRCATRRRAALTAGSTALRA